MKCWRFTATLVAAWQSAFWIAAAAASLSPSVLLAAPASARPAAGSDAVSLPGVGIRMRKPSGFTEAESFHGFQQPDTHSSVMVVRIPGPYSAVSRGFNAEQLKTRGMQLLSKEPVTVDGLPGVLLKLAQSANQIKFMKWTVAFGSEAQTFLVTATFPESRQAQLSAPLKASVLSARLDATSPSDPGAEVSFLITPSSKLKNAPGLGKVLVYTKEGILPAKAPGDPLFVAAPSLGKVPVTDTREFALQRLRQSAKTKVTTVSAHEPIRIDGLEGYESVAEAQETDSGVSLLLYQVLLFEESSYFLMQGLVGAERRDEYLTEFKAMARSFKRKPRG